MRFRALIRCSASAAVLAFSAGAAWAQPGTTAEPPPPPAEGEVAQEEPADDAENQVVVTGFRESLRSSRNIRRNSDQIVDSIVAEDIGKLPDIAVSDTAARIPGVQVVRTGGEASRVLIRGLPDFSTTYNGREIFTAETRVVALQDFPSANIAALEVFKTSTANLVEPGLAGLVNVRSRRPFDFSEGQISASVWGLYSVQADSITPNFNALFTERWETGGGDIGILLNISYTELDYLDSEPSNTDFIADPVINGQRVRFPDIQRLFYRSGNRIRPSVNAAIQWRPNDNLEFYAEGLYQGFRNEIDDRLIAVPLYGGGSYSNLVFRPGTNQLSSGTINGLADPIFTFQGGTFNQTDTYQFAVGAIWEEGPLRVSVDLAHTDSTFTGSTESVDRIFAGQAGTSVDFDLETPQFNIRGFDVNNLNNYLFDGLYEEQQESSGDDIQARIDATYTLEGSFIEAFELGARYVDRSAHREFGNRFAGFRGRGITAGRLPLEYALTPGGFRGTDIQPFRSFLSPTYASIRENRGALRQFVIGQGITCCFGTFTQDPPTPNPDSVYDAFEETIAGYAQIRYDFNDVVDGVIGIRVVQTDFSIDGTAIVAGVPTPITGGQSYTDYLPNASLRWRITPQLQLRLSFSQTRTRPTFADLNPSVNVGPPDPLLGGRRVGGGGNPNLQPFTSDNYDASLEYFFSRTGFASFSVFRRDLFGFIQRVNQDFTDPVLGPLRVNRPINTGSGSIEGFEAQVQTFFDFAGVPSWLRNFGIQANVTYIDAATGFPNNAGGFDFDEIIGVSEWTYNVTGLYENGPLSARLTYNQRSDYLDRRDPRGDDLYVERAQPGDRLDFSVNYNIFENATIFFDWTNILMEPFGVTLESGRAGAPRTEYPRFLRFEETTLSLGLRFRL
jgi:iron complex outermembrane recepter protein